MLDALTATRPLAEHSSKLQLFGQFVGSWSIEGRFFEPDGETEEHEAEWHFGWVLEGRAIQDVLIRPPRAKRHLDGTEHECGTTLRVYHPRMDCWQIVWIAPTAGRVVCLVARDRGHEIWIEGTSPEGYLYRWTFSEITADGFRWQGHQSGDAGQTWFRGQEMVAHRTR